MTALRPLLTKSLLALALFSGWILPLKAQTNSAGTNGSFLPPGDWELVFEDDFNGPANGWKERWVADASSYKHILSSRWPENVTQENGNLRLLNKKEQRGGQEWTAGSVTAKGNRFQYGYYEARYKYAASSGVNNSFWLISKPGEIPQNITNTPAGMFYEIDINEGHYPNQVTCNIHKHYEPKTHSGHQMQLGAKPFFSFPLEQPITTDGIRLVMDYPDKVSINEIRALAVSTNGYPEILDAEEHVLPDVDASLNLLKDAKVEATSQLSPEYGPEHVIDGVLTTASRWVVEGTAKGTPNTLTITLPQPVTIGCLQMLSGWYGKTSWMNCASNYKFQYRKDGQWVDIPGVDKANGYADLSQEYHTYGLEWTPEELVFYFDGKERRRVKNEFCNFPAAMLLSGAVFSYAGKVDDNIIGTSQDIDWVRVWRRKGSGHRVMIPDAEIRAMKPAVTPTTASTTSASSTEEPVLPEGCANFSGSLRGKVVSSDPQGKSFTVALATVTPNDKNQATKPNDLVGKTVTVFPANLQNAQGKWVQAKEDIAFISSLKADQEILFTVYTRTAKPNRLFLDWYQGRSGKKTPSDS